MQKTFVGLFTLSILLILSGSVSAQISSKGVLDSSKKLKQKSVKTTNSLSLLKNKPQNDSALTTAKNPAPYSIIKAQDLKALWKVNSFVHANKFDWNKIEPE